METPSFPLSNGGSKRERPRSACDAAPGGGSSRGADSQPTSRNDSACSSIGATPSKCPRTGTSVTEALEFDAIVVEEVTECTMAGNEEAVTADADGDDEYEYYEEEDDTLVESSSREVPITVEKETSPDEKPPPTRFQARPEEQKRVEPYSHDHLELRRALHRAGIDSR